MTMDPTQADFATQADSDRSATGPASYIHAIFLAVVNQFRRPGDAVRMTVLLAIPILLLAAGAVVVVVLLSSSSSPTVVTCDRILAPGRPDRSAATGGVPVGTIGSLRRGEVGCLRGGEYRFGQLKLTEPDIELTSYPGELAILRGRVWVAAGADGVTFRDLGLDGRNEAGLPSPTVDANAATFDHVDVTNEHTGICFDLGNTEFGRATGTVIEDSRIHDCGQLPSTNQEHGVYLSDADQTVIEGNWIYDNVDRGIQLYPDAQHTRIIGNVIYGNGEGIIFSGNEEVAASDNLVEGNVIADSRIRRNVESYYPAGAPTGTGNLVSANCVFGGADPFYAGAEDSGIEAASAGFTAVDNVVGRPEFVDPAAANFELRPDSACAGVQAASAGVPGAGANS